MKRIIYFLIVLVLLIILFKCVNGKKLILSNSIPTPSSSLYSSNCPYCKNNGCDCIERFGCRKGASGQTICD